MQQFTQRLKEARKLRNVTQDELAKRIKSSRSTLSNYESAEQKEPGYTVLVQIAKALDVTTDYLLGLSDRPDNKQFVFPNDCVGFEKAYKSMSKSLRPNIDPIFDSIYRLLLPDMAKNNPERIEIYADLLRKIASLRNDIRSRIESSGGSVQNAAALSELMSLQSELKNTTSALMDELMQADMRIASGAKKQHYGELPESSAM